MSEALPRRMRGAVLLGPRQVAVRDLPVPRPKAGAMVLRVGAALTCGTDVKVYRRGGHPRMLEAPTLFGHEMSGTVAALGEGARGFRVGDRVVVANSACCGECDACLEGRENLCRDLEYLNGAFAEYLHVPARFVARSTYVIPHDLPFEHAAMAEPLACVLHGIEASELHRLKSSGEDIAVYGGGPIGLLFVAALNGAGQRVILADPNPSRLELGRRLGASVCVPIERGGGQHALVTAHTREGLGAAVAVDCTGVPAGWEDALASVRAGGLVNLFGGCAPGSRISVDTQRVHYGEITLKGVYHHRPANVRGALAMLGEKRFEADCLLSGERPIEEVASALESMMAKKALKVVIRGAGPAGSESFL